MHVNQTENITRSNTHMKMEKEKCLNALKAKHLGKLINSLIWEITKN